MAEVVNIRKAQHLGKLLAQPDLHLVLGGIDTVFSQAARFDVAVQDDHLMAALGDFLRGKHSRWSCTNHKDSLHACPPNDRNRQLKSDAGITQCAPEMSF